MVESFELVPITRAIADTYAQITRRLRAKSQLIGANDLWIAASALQKNIPLVTRNAAEFSRIEGLEVRFY
jgi:tRNA(fMet)-specific endonuclease VapC